MPSNLSSTQKGGSPASREAVTSLVPASAVAWEACSRVQTASAVGSGLASMHLIGRKSVSAASESAPRALLSNVEVAAIQGRLQPGISVGYGLTGFLVAWLSGHNALVAVVVSFLIGGLIAAGDSLQLYAKVSAASATILQGLLFATALAVGGLSRRWGAARG